jgi:outer membrane protein, heavy metal efflux system
MSLIRTFLRFALAIVGLGLLAGCARFHSQPISPAQTATRLESRSLDSPALRTFLETNLHRELTNWPAGPWDFEMLTMAGYYYSPILEVARADWQAASGGIKTAREIPNPTATWSLAHEPVPDANPWIPGLVFDLPIETAGKRRFRTEQARHLAESARLNVATAAWQVRSQVRTSLLDFVSAQQRVELLREQLGLQQDYVSRLQQQLQAGAISAVELNAARLALIRARADLTDAERLLAEARPRLAGAIGLPTTALEGVRVQFDLMPPAAAEGLTASQVRRVALLGRADILSALADYAASQSALQLAVAMQYPDIHLAPGYFWNAGSAGENDWQIGAMVELPILNQHQGPIAEAAARRQASAARFLALQAKVMTDIDIAVASFRAGQSNVTALQELTKAQAAQEQSLREQLKAGAVDRLQLLTSDLELKAAEITRLDAQVKLQQAVGALEDAVQRPLDVPESVWQTAPRGSPANPVNGSP